MSMIPDDAGDDHLQASDQQDVTPQTVDYSLPEDDNPANQDDQANADEVQAAQDDLDDLPVSGDVTGGNHRPGTEGLTGAGIALDDGIDPSLRTEMLDNALAYMDDTPPNNVNDEPGFDEGVPNSISDFSVVTKDMPGGVARLADPSFDAGGEVQGARISGSGGFDGGPPRTTPLPDSTDGN
ncbi:hypothetical protein ACFFLM_23460 [Deinococcus oregonensis]|uniref:Uncharacterized protein n=1 Tax=Deinococcus oregonensis TaxID=1805970 RepID=A0ABV6B6Q7_9DEIO